MREVLEFVRELSERNCRGIVLAERPDITSLTRDLVHTVQGSVLYVAPGDPVSREIARSLRGLVDYVQLRRANRVLGREYGAVIVDLERGGYLTPNTICILADTVRSGGVLLIGVNNLEQWRPGRFGDNYGRYITESIRRCEAHLIVDSRGNVVSRRVPEYSLEPPRRGDLTESQRRLYEEYRRFLETREKILLIRGGRGRGKTYMLGYLSVDLVLRYKLPLLDVYTPDGVFTQAFVAAVEDALRRAMGVKPVSSPRRIETYEFVIRCKKPYERVETPFLLVDEAGRIGIARIRKFLSRAYKTILTLTTFGYEGCGRSFEHILVCEIQRQGLSRSVELHEPVRFAEGDPLERWLNEVFFLKTSTSLQDYYTSAQIKPEDIQFVEIGRDALARDRELLRQVVTLLRDAHYRYSPDDIEVLLDSPAHRLFALRKGEEIVAVAQIRVERPSKSEVKKAVRGVALAGMPVSTILARYSTTSIGSLHIWRVHRVAVKPQYQRRGLGSLLISKVEERGSSEGVDLIAAVYSRTEVTRFWLRNGYKVFYVSPRFNKVTGEYNVGVAKALSSKGDRALKLALQDFKRRLILLASSVYRDLDGELLAEMLRSLDVTCPTRIGTPSLAQRRVEIFLKNLDSYDVEYVQDVLYTRLVEHLSTSSQVSIPQREFTALVIKILQGKSVKDVASSLKVGLETARKILKRAALYVLAPDKAV